MKTHVSTDRRKRRYRYYCGSYGARHFTDIRTIRYRYNCGSYGARYLQTEERDNIVTIVAPIWTKENAITTTEMNMKA